LDGRSPVVALAAGALLFAMAGCRANVERRRVLTIALAVFPDEAARYRRFVREFERREHAHVILVAQSYADILRAMLAEGSAGRGRLDLVELDLAMLGQARKAARPLDSVVSSDAEALFPPAAWDAARFGGHLYFVPHRLMWQAMIYNRLRVARPPRTWDELRAFARAHPGKLALKAARYEGAMCDAMQFVWAAGGDPLDPRSAGSLAAFDFLKSLAPYLDPESQVYREMSVLEAQARGSVWIHFNWPFAMGYLASKGLAPGVDLSAPIPSGPQGTATPLGGGYLAIVLSAPHPRLAADFIRYLLTRTTQLRLSHELGWYGSVAPESASRAARLYAGFLAMKPYVRARPTLACYFELSNRWQRAVRSVLFSGESPRQALDMVGTWNNPLATTRTSAQCACR
jgi:trehalose/maltose transport system substrate-binding protein